MIIHLLIWLARAGRPLFACGALAFAWFVFRLWGGAATRRSPADPRCGGRLV